MRGILSIAALGLALAAGDAFADEIVTYSFTGNIVAGPGTALLQPYVTANDPISGYFTFNASTAPTSPGEWNLADAVFHVQFDTLTFDTVGATAEVGVNQDFIGFHANVPLGEFPVSLTSAILSLGFQTFTDGYFNLASLPDLLPPNDHTLGLSVSDGTLTDGASTDTELFVTVSTSFVPEPATWELFGGGLIGSGMIALIALGRRRPEALRRA